MKEHDEKPFQHLEFLVRDWSFPYEADYGSTGGEKILKRRLSINESQPADLQSIRREIKSCFEHIGCFLMPHPGLDVATNPSFDGQLSDIDELFKKSLLELVPMLLAPENLVVKKIGNHTIKAQDLVLYFNSYLNIFKSEELPEPKSLYLLNAELDNLLAVSAAKEIYLKMMGDCCGVSKPYQSLPALESEHQRAKDKALKAFTDRKLMGGPSFSEPYKNGLMNFMHEQFEHFKEINERKQLLYAVRTPAFFILIAIISYIASGIFAIFGLEAICNLFSILMIIAVVALIIWGYVR